MAALAVGSDKLEIFEHPIKGRCVRSLVQLAPGDVLFQETAVATAPGMEFRTELEQVQHFQCSACFHCGASGNSAWPCEEGCDFAFCSPQCGQTRADVHRSECAYVQGFKDLGAKEGVEAWRLLLASRIAAACATDPGQKERVDLLSDCSEMVARRNVNAFAAYGRIEAAVQVPGFVPCDEGFELEPCSVLATVLCQVHMCSLLLPGPGYRSISALLPVTCLCAHSCRPNCHVAHEGAGVVALRANTAIAAGEEVTISYGVDFGASGPDRRAELEATRCFECVCARCTDGAAESAWDAATGERCEGLQSARYEVDVEKNMNEMQTLENLMASGFDAVACQAGRVMWRTLRSQFHVEEETMAVLAALEPLVEAGWPAHHPFKAQLYLEWARHIANSGIAAEEEFLRCCNLAQANADICFGLDSVESETMKQEMIDGQSEKAVRNALS